MGKVLLIEPNYKNKYPPMGLMKLATYYRKRKDDVRFYKGDLKDLAAKLLCEEFYSEAKDSSLGKHFSKLVDFIRYGKYTSLDLIPDFRDSEMENIIKKYRTRYIKHDFPKFDVIGVTTLFTFYWTKTIDTINFAKKFKATNGRIIVGGIASSILPERVFAETGIEPYVGLLDKPGVLDKDSTDIIDELPLDYSILEEVDYKFPANNAYFGYMTRGCPRNCSFCAVSRLEPEYKNYIGLKQQLEYVDEKFGAQKDLLLMDNNVFASNCFNKIIDEIKECGFGKGATYNPPNEYEIAINNINEQYNLRGYLKKIVKIYDELSMGMSEEAAGDFYLLREENGLLYPETATPEKALEIDDFVRPLYNNKHKKRPRMRYIDFNQGVDARLVTNEKMKKLAEINIKPLRIAFDNYAMKDTYINAIKLAADNGITNLSNYLLYNFKDTPEELYYRMKINVDLCEEHGVTIYSFPMKYHPIDDPEYFYNRNYIGEHWNRKFIRAIQAVLNSTKGKIGRGKSFFEEAFGSDIDEFNKLLWMPETFIIYRRKYDANLRKKLADRYKNRYDDESDLANEWWSKFSNLSAEKLKIVKDIVSLNKFKDGDYNVINDTDINDVLSYYKITREIAENKN